jgi:hypothetical protein
MSRSRAVKIFITYSHSDSSFARKLCADLQSSALELFFDVKSIRGGDRIAERISQGLAECDVYIPILSFRALESPWCKDEINAALALSNDPARNGRPKIISVLVEECQSDMWPLLQGRLNFSFAGRYDEAFQELLERGLNLGTSITSEPSASKTTPETKPKATIQGVRTDLDVAHESHRGMMIHVRFDTHRLRAIKGQLAAYFYRANGEPLKDNDGLYKASDGNIAVSADFSPGYDVTSYDDFKLFMPFVQLHVAAGDHELKYFVNVWNLEDKGVLATSQWVNFSLKLKPIEIYAVWADHNVEQGEEKGMLIHVAFRIDGHKDEKCNLTAYFYNLDNTELKDTDGQYCSADGQVSTRRDFMPSYDSSQLRDFRLFMPYSQAHMPRGIWNLRFRIAIYNSKSQLVSASDWVDFKLTMH